MPYIQPAERPRLEAIAEVAIPLLSPGTPGYAGRLNFLISRILNDSLEITGVTYTQLNEIIGVLECAKQELYRRVLAPYEDKKIEENGDVFNGA